jgi:3-hydroxyisobutyrate dehydrogenase-like beta-hydroxyacid dehydrogenase
MKNKVGFIGLGFMGSKMARNILKRDFHLICYDIRQEAVEKLVREGAEPAHSPMEVAKKSEVVITMLPATQEVEKVVLGTDGIIEGIKKKSVYINMSTSSPWLTKKIAEIFKSKNVDVLGAPVFGAPKAESGEMTIVVGGELKVFNRCRTILECMGKNIFWVGEVGAGEIVKIVNNLLVGVFVNAISEALVLGVKAGVNPDTLMEVFGKTGANSNVLQRHMKQHALQGDFGEGRFSVDYMIKDLKLALNLGGSLNVPMVFGSLANQMYEFARAKGRRANYHPVVLTVLEDIVGVKVRSKKVSD